MRIKEQDAYDNMICKLINSLPNFVQDFIEEENDPLERDPLDDIQPSSQSNGNVLLDQC